MAKQALKPVEFIKHWGCYNKGDVAGFKEDEAERLVTKLKVAKAYTAEATAKEAETSKDKASKGK